MNPESKPIILPKIPSQLIRIALEDIEKTEKDPRYKVMMSFWHEPANQLPPAALIHHKIAPDPAICVVCAAGSVMVQRLGAQHGKEQWPDDFSENFRQLQAINSLRDLEIVEALEYLDIDCSEELRHEIFEYVELDTNFEQYEINPARFKESMKQLADWLEARAL